MINFFYTLNWYKTKKKIIICHETILTFLLYSIGKDFHSLNKILNKIVQVSKNGWCV